MSEKPPILTKIHKGEEIENKKIGEGFETGDMDHGRGVRRKIFTTEDGYFYYADRSILGGQKEVVRVMEIYRVLAKANLPVASFAKTIRKKVDGEIKFFLAMEDITENGKFSLIEVCDQTPRVIFASSNPLFLQDQMIRALAIMHNNRIVDFHPGLSFVLRTQHRISVKGQQEIAKDFRIIDYPNLTKEKLPKWWDGEMDFEEECFSDLKQLLEGIVYQDTQKQHLKHLYKQIRETGENKF